MAEKCFFCDKETFLPYTGWFAPDPMYEDVRVMFCKECAEKAQGDWKSFFQALDLDGLVTKYEQIWMRTIKERLSRTYKVIETDGKLIILPKGDQEL